MLQIQLFAVGLFHIMSEQPFKGQSILPTMQMQNVIDF